MKVIIKNKIYDTDDALLLCGFHMGFENDDEDYAIKLLFVTRDRDFFTYHDFGCNSNLAVMIDGTRCGYKFIKPCSELEAQALMKLHGSPKVYRHIWGDEEDEEPDDFG